MKLPKRAKIQSSICDENISYLRCNLKDFIDKLYSYCDGHPPEDAEISFSKQYAYYEDVDIKMNIVLTRDETDEEYEKRLDKAKKIAEGKLRAANKRRKELRDAKKKRLKEVKDAFAELDIELDDSALEQVVKKIG